MIEKKFENNNLTIALDVKNKYFNEMFQSNSFNDSEGRGMALSCSKKLSALLKGIMSKHHGNLYCLNCLHSFTMKNKLECHEKLFENKGFCNIVISSKATKTKNLICTIYYLGRS